MLSAIVPPISKSLQASVTAVGLLLTTSIAKLGPESIAMGFSGRISSVTWLIRLKVEISIPFEQSITGVSDFRVFETSNKVSLVY